MMEASNEKSPEVDTLSFQSRTGKTTAQNLSQDTNYVNSRRFLELLAHQGIYLTTPRGLVRCIFHQEKTPSLSIDTERGVFHCFGCGKSGGVKAFALAVGESWGTTRYSSRERARFAVQARRRQAEEQARAILVRRKDERDDNVWAAWGEANTKAADAAELLALFFHRPALAEEFPTLVEDTESEYSDALFQKMLIEAQFAGEVVA